MKHWLTLRLFVAMALWWLGEILTVEAIAGKYKGNSKTLRTFVLAMFPRAMSQFILADVLQIRRMIPPKVLQMHYERFQKILKATIYNINTQDLICIGYVTMWTAVIRPAPPHNLHDHTSQCFNWVRRDWYHGFSFGSPMQFQCWLSRYRPVIEGAFAAIRNATWTIQPASIMSHPTDIL